MGNVEPETKMRAIHFININPELSQSVAGGATNFFHYPSTNLLGSSSMLIPLFFPPSPYPVPLLSFLFGSMGPDPTGSKLNHHEHTPPRFTNSDSQHPQLGYFPPDLISPGLNSNILEGDLGISISKVFPPTHTHTQKKKS